MVMGSGFPQNSFETQTQKQVYRIHMLHFCVALKINSKQRTELKTANTGVDPGFGQGGPQLLRPKVADVAKRAFCGRGPGPT